MSEWTDGIAGSESPPLDLAIAREERRREVANVPSEADRELLDKVRREMRLTKPHYYVVFQAVLEHGDIFARWAESGPSFDCRVYRGFFTELSKRLGIKPNTVKYRMKKSLEWFVMRARVHLEYERGARR